MKTSDTEKLPLGSVVQLKNATNLVIVIGYNGTNGKPDSPKYDYIALQYPMGFVSPKFIYGFNTEQILKIFYSGEQSDKHLDFDLKNEFLPLGSIVKIRFHSERMLIVGYYPILSGSKEIYSYLAVPYSTGFINNSNYFFINRNIIKYVYSLGYVDLEASEFLKKLKIIKKEKNYEN